MTDIPSAPEEPTFSPRRIAANIGWLTMGNGISLVISAAYGISLARLMGPSLFGDYAYVSSLLALAAPLASFGLPMVLVREMSNRPKDRANLTGSAMVLFFFLSLGAILLLLVSARFFVREERLYISLCILSLSLMGGAVGAGVGPVFIASEKMRYNALLRILGSVLGPLIVIPLVLLIERLEAIMGGVTTASFVGGAIAYVLLLRVMGQPGLKWDLKSWRFLLGQSLPLFVGDMFSGGFDRADVLVLHSARGPVAVGQYRAVYQVVQIMRVFLSSLATALSPTVYRSAEEDVHRHAQVFRLVTRWTWALFLWLALCISLAARPLTGLLYGREFTVAAPAMAVLAWSLPLMAVTYSIGNFFVAAGKQIYSIHVWAAALLTNVAANLLLTYRLGMMGAAASMVISSVAFCATQLFLAHSRLGLRLEWGKAVVLLLSGGAAWSVSRLLVPGNASVSLLAASGVYFGMAFCTRAASWQEVRTLRGLVARR